MRLIGFDFDGTLSDSEMTELLGRRMGVEDEMAEITARAMNDEIGYADSLRRRAALLEGLDVDRAEDAYDEVELRPGAAAVVDRLRRSGAFVAILTGGFESGVERALASAGVEVDAIVANRLPAEDGQLTGEVEGPLVEGTKDDALAGLAADLELDLEETIAVGDGANDLPMLEVAGLSIGYLPKPAVRPACDVVVTSMNRLERVFEAYDVLE